MGDEKKKKKKEGGFRGFLGNENIFSTESRRSIIQGVDLSPPFRLLPKTLPPLFNLQDTDPESERNCPNLLLLPSRLPPSVTFANILQGVLPLSFFNLLSFDLLIFFLLSLSELWLATRLL